MKNRSKYVCVILACVGLQFFVTSSVASNGFFNLLLKKKGSDSQSVTITAENDDGEIWTDGPIFEYDGEFGTTDYTGVYQSTPVFTFLRFQLTKAIPAGATITSSSLSVRGVDTYGWHNFIFYLQVRANDSANAAQVASINDYPGGPSGLTFTSSVNWPTAGYLVWDGAGTNTTPDLKSTIQFLVNKYGGLAAGAHVQFWVYSDQPGIDVEGGMADFGTPDFNTVLDINWTP